MDAFERMEMAKECSNGFAAQTDHYTLDVAVVGAGIAGLTAAIALAKSSHNVAIYERSKFSNEVGAAIVVAPNSSRILNRDGFDFEQAGATILTEMEYIDGSDLAVQHKIQCDQTFEKYNGKWYALHRADLHSQLRRQALSYSNVQLFLDTNVVTVETCGELILHNGEIARKDLVVVADGIKSDFAHLVAGHPVVNDPAGFLAFRFCVDTSEILADPRTRALYESNPRHKFFLAAHEELKLVGYPCRDGSLQNYCLFHKDDSPFDHEAIWNIDATLTDLREYGKRLNPALEALCEHATQIGQWRMTERNKIIETLFKDRTVLVGDAAHPMLPFQGQGAGMAIEDAAALGVLLSNITSRNEIPSRLALFQKLRKDRVCAMQIFSRPEQNESTTREAAKYVRGELPACPADYHAFGLRPDVTSDARILLQKHLRSVCDAVKL